MKLQQTLESTVATYAALARAYRVQAAGWKQVQNEREARRCEHNARLFEQSLQAYASWCEGRDIIHVEPNLPRVTSEQIRTY